MPTKYDLRGGSKTSLHALTQLDGRFKLDLAKVDGYHQRQPPFQNPFADKAHFVELLHSQRRIRISYKGQELAQSDRWLACFEGSLGPAPKNYPLRYYIPKKDVKEGVLSQPSDATSHCPFKGDAEYYKLDGQDLIWAYPRPTTASCAELSDTIAFYHDKEGFTVEVGGGDILYPKSWPFQE